MESLESSTGYEKIIKEEEIKNNVQVIIFWKYYIPDSLGAQNEFVSFSFIHLPKA